MASSRETRQREQEQRKTDRHRRLIRTRIRIRTRNRTRIRIRARIRNSSSRLTQQEMVKELRLENRLRKRRPRQMEQKLWMLQMLF